MYSCVSSRLGPVRAAILFLSSATVLLEALIANGPQDVPPTVLEGRAEFGVAQYLSGSIVLGAHGVTITDSDIIRDQSNQKFLISTSANEVFIGFPLGVELSPNYKYNFVLKSWTPNDQWHYPQKILFNDEVVWDIAPYLPLPTSKTDPAWQGRIDIPFETAANNDGVDDIIWIVVKSDAAPETHILHLRPPVVVEYYRENSISSRTAPATLATPGSLLYPDAVFISDTDADLPQPDVPAIIPSTIKSPVWPIIGSELEENRLDPDVYDYLVDRGINMVYYQDDSYVDQLDDPNHPLRSKITSLTTVDTSTGESPLKIIAAKYQTHRRFGQFDPVGQLGLMEDLGNLITDPNSTTDLILYTPEVSGSEMTRYLNKSQSFADGDWAEIIDGTTQVFQQNNVFPSGDLFDYLSEWESALSDFNEDILDDISGQSLGLIQNTQMAGFTGLSWMYRSLPDYVPGEPLSFIQNKTLLRQNVNIVVSNVRGHAKAFDRLMATRVDAWAGERSTWFASQMERAYRAFYYGGTDVIDHESGEAITHDSNGNIVPNARGAALFEVASWIRTREARGVVNTPIALMSGRGSIFGRVGVYDWENLQNYMSGKLDIYAADLDLYNVFFSEFGDRYQTKVDRLFTGTPYGPIDIVPGDAPNSSFYQDYDLLAVIGLNAMNTLQASAMIDYVNSGGTLVIAAGQLMNESVAGTRKLSVGGDNLLSAFGAGVALDSNGKPIELVSSISDLRNFSLVAGSGVVDETWTTKTGGSTNYPQAVVYSGSNGGELVLLSGEILINTGLAEDIDMADPSATYAGQLLARYAESATNVLTDPSETNSDYIETIVLEDAEKVTLALLNHANFGLSDISAFVGNFNETVKLRRSLFPGMTAANLAPVYLANGETTPTITVDDSDPDFFSLSVRVNEWKEISISKLISGNQLINGGFEDGLSNWNIWNSSGGIAPSIETDSGNSSVLVGCASTCSPFNASVSQTLSNLAAGDYVVSFKYKSGAANWTKATVQLFVDGVLVQSADLSANQSSWTDSSQTISLSSGANLEVKFWFKDITDTTISLDDVVVQNNLPPVWDTDFMASPAPDGQVGVAYSLNNKWRVTDPEDDVLTFTKVSGPSWVSIDSNGKATGTPTAGDAGYNSVVLSVSDGTNPPVEETMVVYVPSFPPVWTTDFIAWPAPDAQAGVAYSLNNQWRVADPEGDTLTFSKVSGPSWVSIDSNGKATGTPGNGDGGSNAVVISVSDGTNPPVNATMTVNVVVPNLPPVWTTDFVTLPAQDGQVGVAYSLNNKWRVTDPDGDTLSFTKVSGPTWVSIDSNGKATGIPGAGDVGLNTVVISVSDGVNSSVNASMDIDVLN